MSFEQLRTATAVKLFGQEFVDSRIYKIAFLEEKIKEMVHCINRDEANLKTITKKRMKSLITESIYDDKVELLKLTKQMTALLTSEQ